MSYSASMKDKRAALAELVKDTLDALLTDATEFVVEERFRGLLVDSADKADRDDFMGKPVRYARVSHLGNDDAAVAARLAGAGGAGREGLTFAGAVAQTPHVFGVYVWFQYVDADTYLDSSQAAWDDLIEADALGLLPVLRENGGIEAGGTVCHLLQPEDVFTPPEPLNLGDDDFVHYLQFTITIM